MNFNFNSKCILTIEMKLFVEACLSISNIFVYANNDVYFYLKQYFKNRCYSVAYAVRKAKMLFCYFSRILIFFLQFVQLDP